MKSLGVLLSCLFALAVASGAALVPAAQSADQPRTTAPPPVVTIKVTITDARISMTPKRAQRGTFARFVLVNTGSRSHTFTLGHQRAGTGTQTGFTKSLKPRAQSILLLFLDFRGTIPYLGSLPADRLKPAMRGIFTVT